MEHLVHVLKMIIIPFLLWLMLHQIQIITEELVDFLVVIGGKS